MCGIAVLLGAPGTPGNPDEISALTTALAHRGPDDAGVWNDGNLAFGHRRLSILDLSPGGHQPMSSPDGRYWITYNGEVYNYRELRAELEAAGRSFRSRSDTEVLLAAYAEWGEKMLPRLIGMFAFAITDTRERTLFVARDFFGIKPLHYWQGAGGVAFASEIKALLRVPGVRRRANPGAIYRYLLSGDLDREDETFFAEIRRLPAAHFAKLKLDRPGDPIAPQRYWSPEQEAAAQKAPEGESLDQAAERLRALFLESVSLHLRSDVPVGAALSGGIDSSSIVLAMRKLSGPELDLHAFSFIPDSPELSERRWIELAVGASKARLHLIRIAPGDLARDADALIRTQDEPFGSTSIYAQYRVFRAAREQGIKVMLDGQGSDELFAGYFPYLGARLSSLVRGGHWVEALRFTRAVGRHDHAGLRACLLHSGRSLLPTPLHGAARRLIGKPLVPDWLSLQWLERSGIEPGLPEPVHSRDFLKSELLDSLTCSSLPALLRYEDRNSMAHSIESRVPFLTPALAGFALSLPERFLIDSQANTKAVLRRAMRGLVPDAILNRRDKIGFATDEGAWLRELRPWVESVLKGPVAASQPILKLDRVRDHLESAGPRLWRWINLIRWTEIYEVELDQ